MKNKSKRYQVTLSWKESSDNFKIIPKILIHLFQFIHLLIWITGRSCYWDLITLHTKMDCSFCTLNSPTIIHSELLKFVSSHQFTTVTWTHKDVFATVFLIETIHLQLPSKTLLNVFMDWFWHLNLKIHSIMLSQVSI